jgi:two-component system cell cycle sensor histidine kinase/response regulator CckA
VLDDRIHHYQRLYSLGSLAASVAHDFKNILHTISGYAEMLIEEAQDAPSLLDYARRVQNGAALATALTSQILDFSSPERSRPKRLRLNEPVVTVLALLRAVIGEKIEVVLDLDPKVGWVMADPIRLEQVVLNLIMNARDAMAARGGNLTIETADVTLNEAPGAIGGLEPGRHSMLAISDTGVGMDEQIKARIFEPFFTTKPAGEGTGLGLLVVREVVRENRGAIRVDSEPGKGTTIRVYLPIHE